MSRGEQVDPLVRRSSRLPTAVSRDRKSRLPYGRANSLAKPDSSPSLTARYASPPGHSGIGSPQKKNTRLPGPSRVPAAGSGASRSPGSSNLNRRSQSFNSIDKSKPLQYASGNDRGEGGVLPIVLESCSSVGADGRTERPFSHSPSWPLGGTTGSDRRGCREALTLPVLSSLLNHPQFFIPREL
ncbi:hypothetical protein VZT92_016141 [Zoarces viviparus]|uniref:Uncharacterized protein n=1 Tax=Zoarces viviparus TaxID=48416 RepID=A0AAW1ETU1_ZOAVI